MKILEIFNYVKAKFRATTIPLIPVRDPALKELFGITDNVSGVEVDENSSLGFSAYFSALNLLASTIAMSPCHLIEKATKKVVEGNAADYLLSVKPNQTLTPFMFHHTWIHQCLGWGNGYAEIIRVAGIPTALINIHPAHVSDLLTSPDGQDYYDISDGNGKRKVLAENMLHLMFFSIDGRNGITMLNYMRLSLSTGIAGDTFASSFFGNSSKVSGVITHPMSLSDQASKRLHTRLEQQHQGPYRANKLLLLDEGMKFEPTSIPPEDAQFLQSRQFQVVEIARWFRIPPHMLFDTTDKTFSTVEQGNKDFKTYSVNPLIVRAIQEQNRKLDPRKGEGATCFHYDTGLIETQSKTERYTNYATGRNNGWLTLNDILGEERMPLLPPGIGDNHLAPSTMKTLEVTDYDDSVSATEVKEIIEIFKNAPATKAADAKPIIQTIIPKASPEIVDSIIRMLQQNRYIAID